MYTQPTYHFVSHSHWDREWYHTFDEFRVWLVDMIDELFEVIESNPDFNSFMFDGQTAMIQDYLEIKPDRKEPFKKFVQQKKFIIGPWYLQIDQFLPSGESHIRNLLIGIHDANELGGAMMVGYIPDQFGHIAQMPQMLSGFDIDSAVIYRGFGGEPGQESSEYFWRSPDGSHVLMLHLPKDGYSFGYFSLDSNEQIIERFNRLRSELDARAQTSHRLILNGGDHFWVDQKITEAIQLIREDIKVNQNCHFERSEKSLLETNDEISLLFAHRNDTSGTALLHTSLPVYFQAIKSELENKQLPIASGELRFGLKHAFAVINGTASSRMYVKQTNYGCEILLEKILEPLNAVAILLGKKSQSAFIKQAWRYLLQNQDHDVICGTSIDRVYDEAMIRFEKVRSIIKETQRLLLNDIIPYDSKYYEDDKTLILMNIIPHERDEVIGCEIEFFLKDVIIGINPDATTAIPREPISGFKICDHEGMEMPFQIVERTEDYGIVYSKHAYPHQTWVERFKILLYGKNLPACGYTQYSIVKTYTLSTYKSELIVSDKSIENSFLKMSIDDDRSISVLNKITNDLWKGLIYFEDSGDVGDEYTFCPPDQDAIIDSRKLDHQIEIIESGPLRVAMQLKSKVSIPKSASSDFESRSIDIIPFEITTTFYLNQFSKRIDVQTEINNSANDHRVRVVFDTGIPTNISYADSAFAIVKREHQKYDWNEFTIEKPLNLEIMQKFVTIQNDKRAFTLMTKGLPEYELMNDSSGKLALTLLRCIGELSRSNLKTRPGGDAGWKNKTPGAQCRGIRKFEYSIFVHEPTKNFSEVIRELESYHSPIISVMRKHEVNIPLERVFIEMKSNHSIMSTMKESENCDGVVFRVYNPVGEYDEVQCKINFDFKKIIQTKLNENEIDEVQTNKSQFSMKIAPYKIVTIKVMK